jgi:hypothetical protein
MESLLVGADLHLRIHVISLTAIHRYRKLTDRPRSDGLGSRRLNFDGWEAVIP